MSLDDYTEPPPAFDNTPRAICPCGAPITQPAKGRRRKYCSDGCRRAADNKAHGHTVKADRKQKTCARENCHNPLCVSGRGRPSDYCSNECKRARTPKPTPERGYVSEAVREAVFARDGFKCLSCGSRAFLEVDHIISVHNNGPSWMINYQTLCRDCNHRKGTQNIRYEGAPII